MTFFLFVDNQGHAQLVRAKGAMPWMKELLNQYHEWLAEARTRKKFFTTGGANAAKGGVNGFIWFLDLIDEGVETFSHEYLEKLNVITGKDLELASNPDIA